MPSCHSGCTLIDVIMSGMSLDALTAELQRIDRMRRTDPEGAATELCALTQHMEALIAALSPVPADQVANDNASPAATVSVDDEDQHPDQ